MGTIKRLTSKCFSWDNIFQELLWFVLGILLTRGTLYALRVDVREMWFWVFAPLVVFAFLTAIGLLRRSSHPALTGHIDNMIAGRIAEGYTALLVYISVRNRGAQTSIENWGVVVYPTGNEPPITAPLRMIFGTITMTNTKGEYIRLVPHDNLLVKTIDPVPRGSFVRGYIVCEVAGVTQERIMTPGNRIEVFFQDVWGQIYRTHVDLIQKEEGAVDNFYPGFLHHEYGRLEGDEEVRLENVESHATTETDGPEGR